MHQNPEQDVPDAHGVHLDPVLATSLEGLAVVQLGGQILPQVCLPEVGVRLGGDGMLGLEGQVIPQVLLTGLDQEEKLLSSELARCWFSFSAA